MPSIITTPQPPTCHEDKNIGNRICYAAAAAAVAEQVPRFATANTSTTCCCEHRLKAALAHHPGGMANGSMNSMGHMMEMMPSRQDQAGHHHLHSHPHQHMQGPPHGYPHHTHHHPGHAQSAHHHPQSHGHHNSHPPHLHPAHGHQTSPHQPMHSAVSQKRIDLLQEAFIYTMELYEARFIMDNEVTMLKNEVTQLKQLLLTHKDCPITAMQKESQGYLSPESSPAGSPTPVTQQQVIQHNTITTSSTAPNHRTDINPIH
ncbi:hypothetical protein cypCar_00030796 [Cyprinus carpio]|nr:hypothetical protein cypCar_00030796 [Cyprinus carpio]